MRSEIRPLLCKPLRVRLGAAVFVVALAGVGVGGALRIVRADDSAISPVALSLSKQAVPLQAPEPPPAVAPEGGKLNANERNNLHKELDGLLKQREQLNARIGSLRLRLGERDFDFTAPPAGEMSADMQRAREEATREVRDAMRQAREAMREALRAQGQWGDFNVPALPAIPPVPALPALPAFPAIPPMPRFNAREGNGPDQQKWEQDFRKQWEDWGEKFRQGWEQNRPEFESRMHEFEKQMETWSRNFETQMQRREKTQEKELKSGQKRERKQDEKESAPAKPSEPSAPTPPPSPASISADDADPI